MAYYKWHMLQITTWQILLTWTFFKNPSIVACVHWLKIYQTCSKTFASPPHKEVRKNERMAIACKAFCVTCKHKKLEPLFTELFIWGRKLIIFFVFITQSQFAVPQKCYFIMKIPNERELQQIAINYSSGSEFKDYKPVKKNTKTKKKKKKKKKKQLQKHINF